jgi:hypothetical protein
LDEEDENTEESATEVNRTQGKKKRGAVVIPALSVASLHLIDMLGEDGLGTAQISWQVAPAL